MSIVRILKKAFARIRFFFESNNRNLFRELIRAELKATDSNSTLGIMWSLLGPLAMLAVMLAIFKAFYHGSREYPLYLLLGITCVNFFITTTTYTVRIFHMNREVILNSTIPREILIVAKIFIFVYKFSFELLLCCALSLYYGVFSFAHFAMLPLLLVGFIAFSVGIGLMLALVFCFVADIEHIWMLVGRLLYFVTPIFYTLQDIPARVANLVYWGNPLSNFLSAFRGIFIAGKTPFIFDYWYSIGMGMACMIVGYCIFLAIENIAVEKA